jgi:hypothetical protein
MIVSVSRRCDIPRYQFKWFMERVRAGYVVAVNPFNANQQKRISLVPGEAGEKPPETVVNPDGIDAFVFWTRDPRHILANADEIEERGFHYYVMITVTGYPHELEPHMVSTEKAIRAMKELARKIGPERVIWRYDPIILSTITDEDFHRTNFNALAHSLSGSVRRVIISLYNEYEKSQWRFGVLKKAGVVEIIKARAGYGELLADLAQSAGAAGMEIQSCATQEDYSLCGIKPGACIDGGLINTLWGVELTGKDKNQRPHCLCRQSVDIGTYGMCAARCVYCYAW